MLIFFNEGNYKHQCCDKFKFTQHSYVLSILTYSITLFSYSLFYFSESVGDQASARTAVAVSGPTPVAVSTAANTSATGPRECAGCGKRITERFLLKALDLFWHEDCLKCGCCDCRLGEVGSTLYTKANLILCKRDYLRSINSYRNS